MTRAALYTTIRDKLPYECHPRRSDEAGKTRAALQNRYELLIAETILLLPNFVFFEINKESEYSDGEFTNTGPANFSDAELSCHLTPKAQKKSEHSPHAVSIANIAVRISEPFVKCCS